MKVDIHSHFFFKISQQEAVRPDVERVFWLATLGREGQIMLNDKPFRAVYDALWDAPFPLGEQKIGHLVSNTALQEKSKHQILGENA